MLATSERPRRRWSVGVLALALLVGPPDGLGATPAQKCAGAKAKAFGVAVKRKAQCHAKARQRGVAVDPTCLQKAQTKLRVQFAKAEKAAACPDDVAAALSASTACATTIAEATDGSTGCAARKIKAAGEKAAGKSACAKKAALKGLLVETSCLEKVERKFGKAVGKADRKGSCTGTAAELEEAVDACLASLARPIPCAGGTGHPACNGTCPDGLTCRPHEVFENGVSTEMGCSCVDVLQGPACGGTTCGTDQHCEDPTEVCERWLTGDPLGCDHMICQPARTTPTTLPQREMLECDGGEFPTCGGACPNGERCQPAQALFDVITVFAGCVCVDPRGPRCEMPAECDISLLPFSHCADPTKVCLITLADADDVSCTEAHCGDPRPIVLPPTTTTSTTVPSSTSTTTTTSTSTSTTILCTSTPGVSGCFQDLGDCTILDTCTGLQWEQKTATPGLHDVGNLYTWSGCCDHDCSTVETHCQPNAAASATCMALADNGTEGCGLCASGTCFADPFNRGAITTIWDWISQVNADNFAGHSDWRIAREYGLSMIGGERELESILLMPYPCGTSPCIDPIFGPTMPDIYWTATTKGPTGELRPSDAWFVGFGDGGWGDAGKWGHLYVRAVR